MNALHARCEFLDADLPLVIAHRGGRTESGSDGALSLDDLMALDGYLEADITATADDVPILWHPRGIDRLQPHSRIDLAAEGLRIGDLQTERVSGESIVLRLDEVLDAHPALRAFIDVKKWPAVSPTAKAIWATNAVNRVSIGTFSQARTNATAREIRRLTGREVCTAMGPIALGNLALRSLAGDRGQWRSPYRTAQLPNRVVTRRLVETAHRAGVAVLPWTVNAEPEMHRLLDLGVDGLITDYPIRLRRVLDDRAAPSVR